MSPEIIAALTWLVRILIMNVCGGFLIAHGIVSKEQLSDFANNTTVAVFGAAAFIATFGWSLYARRKAAVIARVAALPEVTSIHATPEVAAAQPSDKVVPVPPAQP